MNVKMQLAKQRTAQCVNNKDLIFVIHVCLNSSWLRKLAVCAKTRTVKSDSNSMTRQENAKTPSARKRIVQLVLTVELTVVIDASMDSSST